MTERGASAVLAAVLPAVLACADGPAPTGPACTMPDDRTVVRSADGAILETWDLALDEVRTERLPDVPAFLEYRAAIERDGGDLRRPVADPPVTDTEELAAIWRDEFFNNDRVYEDGVGTIVPISCLDALLFARQAMRVSQLDRPTEFAASVLRREEPQGPRLKVVFAAGSEMLVPRGWYGFDLVADHVEDGWTSWYAIHNHTTQTNDGRLALGVPVPSTSDVGLLRGLGESLGLDSLRVTNGFYTFHAAVSDLDGFRAR
ncbi:MAG: hypothetical protein RJQ04_13755 [Longimicrobiales bacterium]